MPDDSQQEAQRNPDGSSDLAKAIHWTTHATFWSQVGLGVVALLALAVYYCQLEAFNKATTNATETQTATDMPLVLPSAVTLANRRDDDGDPVIRVTQSFTDEGASRANHPVIAWQWGEQIPDPPVHYVHVQDAWRDTTWIKGAVASDALNIPKSVMGHLQSTDSSLFLFGTIRYEDVFPLGEAHKRRDHLVQYCVELTNIAVSDAGVAYNLNPCVRMNCYDLDCPASEYTR